jgi:hypothetical protein
MSLIFKMLQAPREEKYSRRRNHLSGAKPKETKRKSVRLGRAMPPLKQADEDSRLSISNKASASIFCPEQAPTASMQGLRVSPAEGGAPAGELRHTVAVQLSVVANPSPRPVPASETRQRAWHHGHASRRSHRRPRSPIRPAAHQIDSISILIAAAGFEAARERMTNHSTSRVALPRRTATISARIEMAIDHDDADEKRQQRRKHPFSNGLWDDYRRLRGRRRD